MVEQLRQKKRSKTNIGANVLLFVAVLFAFVVFMREWNKGRPKEATMFGGGGDEPADQAAAPIPAGSTIRGAVKLAIDSRDTGTLFVMVRNAGSPDRGPPVAVKKIDAPAFPVSFEVSPADVMMKGMPFTGPFDVYARLDRDGDPMTRDPEDLVVSVPAAGAVPGTGAIELSLDRRVRDGAAPAPSPGGAAPAPAPSPGAAAPAPAPAAAAPSPTPSSAPAAAAAGSAATIAGEVRLDPSVASGAPDGALFIIVRSAGMGDRGPPLAVKKIDHPSWPVRFEIGASDVMMEGMPFIGPFDVTARLDADGNAMTKVPGDLELSAPKAGVPTGERALLLVLDRRR